MSGKEGMLSFSACASASLERGAWIVAVSFLGRAERADLRVRCVWACWLHRCPVPGLHPQTWQAGTATCLCRTDFLTPHSNSAPTRDYRPRYI